MTKTIESWYKMEEVLSTCSQAGKLIGQVLAWKSEQERVAWIDFMLEACLRHFEDESCVSLLEARQRAVGPGTSPSFNVFLEDFYWKLPVHQLVRGASEPAFVKTRLHICRLLIREWGATPNAETAHAFRRLIAMGWSESERQLRRAGESDVEVQARGRRVSDEERKGILEIIRNHMEGFGSWEERKAGPDTLFDPWLRQSHVPEDIQKLLVIARAKMGGAALAQRDIRNGGILDGIPCDGLELLRTEADGLRRLVREVNEALERLLARLGETNPMYQARQYLERACYFEKLDELTIRIGPAGDPDDLFAEMATIIVQMRNEGRLTACRVNLDVRGGGLFAQEEEGRKLTKSWPKKRTA